MVKTAMISTRALPEEKAALQAIARQERRPPAAMLRELIRKEAQERGLWPPAGSAPSPRAGGEM